MCLLKLSLQDPGLDSANSTATKVDNFLRAPIKEGDEQSQKFETNCFGQLRYTIVEVFQSNRTLRTRWSLLENFSFI